MSREASDVPWKFCGRSLKHTNSSKLWGSKLNWKLCSGKTGQTFPTHSSTSKKVEIEMYTRKDTLEPKNILTKSIDKSGQINLLEKND